MLPVLRSVIRASDGHVRAESIRTTDADPSSTRARAATTGSAASEKSSVAHGLRSPMNSESTNTAMSPETSALIHELRNPHNDFPTYLTDLCARAADKLERAQKELAVKRSTQESMDLLTSASSRRP
jgi:hypothetical protein